MLIIFRKCIIFAIESIQFIHSKTINSNRIVILINKRIKHHMSTAILLDIVIRNNKLIDTFLYRECYFALLFSNISFDQLSLL